MVVRVWLMLNERILRQRISGSETIRGKLADRQGDEAASTRRQHLLPFTVTGTRLLF
jgi:hypothetical protein